MDVENSNYEDSRAKIEAVRSVIHSRQSAIIREINEDPQPQESKKRREN